MGLKQPGTVEGVPARGKGGILGDLPTQTSVIVSTTSSQRGTGAFIGDVTLSSLSPGRGF